MIAFLQRIMSIAVPTKQKMRAIAALWAVIAALFAYRAFSDEGIFVGATVGNAAKSPLVISVSPGLAPITVSRSSSQTVSLTVNDADSAGGSIAYTLSVASWAVVPHNGTASIWADGSTNVDFTYYSPSYKAKLVPVTVTLDDQSWAPVTVKTVDFYVY